MKNKLILISLYVLMITFVIVAVYNHFDQPVDFDCVSYYESIGADVSECY